MLAAHFRDRAERTKPIAAFRYLEKREVPRRDPQPGRIGQRVRRRGMENGPLFGKSADKSIGNFGHVLTTKYAYEVVDPRA